MTGRWRTGRKVGRTIYIQTGPEPSDRDVLIGLMDTADMARTVVDAVNVNVLDRDLRAGELQEVADGLDRIAGARQMNNRYDVGWVDAHRQAADLLRGRAARRSGEAR